MRHRRDREAAYRGSWRLRVVRSRAGRGPLLCQWRHGFISGLGTGRGAGGRALASGMDGGVTIAMHANVAGLGNVTVAPILVVAFVCGRIVAVDFVNLMLDRVRNDHEELWAL